MLKYLERGGIKDSFSILHTLAYTVIALQELNLIFKYNPLYWNTACLTVNSGGIESEEDDDDIEIEDGKPKKKYATNYGKVAAAIGTIRQRGVKVSLPDINKAKFGFSPDIENDSIIFGLKGMNGIGDDVVHLLMEHRPYNSFEDFLTRMFDTKLIKNGQMIQLIKGGCFESFGERKDIMKEFLQHTFEPKKQLTMQNMNGLITNGLIPEEFNINERYFKYKNYISQSVFKTLQKPKDRLFILDDIASQFFEQHFTEDCIVETHEGSLVISEKKFIKEYDKKMEDFKEWLKKEETLDYVNKSLFEQESAFLEDESISKWEMDSLSFYYHDHELSVVNNEKYGISVFNELPETPKVVKEYVSRGIPRQEFELSRIAGTVLDRDKNKHQVTLLTMDGVVTVKFYAGAFSHYNKQISRPIGNGKKEVVEPSWFTRGNKLIVTGFRRGNKFVPRKYKNSIYQHTVALITEIGKNGDITLQTERSEV